MSTVQPVPTNGPVEKKVKAATIATYVGLAVLLAILNAFTDPDLINLLPDWAEVLVAPILPTLITFVAGYMAKHTPRTYAGSVDSA